MKKFEEIIGLIQDYSNNVVMNILENEESFEYEFTPYYGDCYIFDCNIKSKNEDDEYMPVLNMSVADKFICFHTRQDFTLVPSNEFELLLCQFLIKKYKTSQIKLLKNQIKDIMQQIQIIKNNN